MNEKEPIFDLIQSMSKAEKRYFKLFAKMQGKVSDYYLDLFDAINKQSEYDENILQRKFRKEIKQFSVAKHRLYLMVLKSLRFFLDNEHEVDNMLREAQILLNRRLITQAERLAEKCEVKIEEYDVYERKYAINTLKVRIERIKTPHPKYGEAIEQYSKAAIEGLEAVESDVRYIALFSKLVYLNYISSIHHKDTAQQIKELIEDPLLQDVQHAKTFHAKDHFYFIHSFYGVITRNYPYVYEYTKKRMHLLDQEGQNFVNPEYCHTVYNNFINAAYLLEKYDECALVLEKFKTIQTSHEPQKIRIELNYYYWQLMLYLHGANEAKLKKVLQAFKAQLKVHSMLLPLEQIYAYYVQLAGFSMIVADYQGALFFLEEVKKRLKQSKGNYMYRRACILELLVHFELGNDLLLPYKARSVYRELYKTNVLYEYEKVVLQFIRNDFPKIIDRKDLKDLLQKWLDALSAIEDGPQERLIYDSFSLKRWLAARIKEKRYLEVLE